MIDTTELRAAVEQVAELRSLEDVPQPIEKVHEDTIAGAKLTYIIGRQWPTIRALIEENAALRKKLDGWSSTHWRVGSKVKLNVYNGDRPVCQCHSAEEAQLIVDAVNGTSRLIEDNVALRAKLEAAPHASNCVTMCGFVPCNCWKAGL